MKNRAVIKCKIYIRTLLLALLMQECAIANDYLSITKNNLVESNQVNPPYKGLLVSAKNLWLLANVATKGIETPKKIFKGKEFGHNQNITPSSVVEIKKADTIFWYGKEIEASLAKILIHQKKSVPLLRIESLELKKPRSIEVKLNDVEINKIDGIKKNKNTVKNKSMYVHQTDPHVWLDPIRAQAIVTAIAKVRSEQYPKYKKQYLQNAKEFSKKMFKLVKESKNEQLEYLSYHDAYQYLDSRLNMTYLGSLTSEPEIPFKINQLKKIKQLLDIRNKKTCMLVSEQKLINNLGLIKGKLNIIVLDPKMNTYDNYEEAINKIVKQLQQCKK